MIDLRGKRAVVTGGSRGIGAATARLLARCGADVLVGFRTRVTDADAIVAELRAAGVRGAAHGGDLTTADGAAALFDAADRELGGVDIYVANAGVWPSAEVPLAELTSERWRDTMLQNVDAIFYTTREAARRICADGRIVMVSSTAAQRGEAMHADYAASKGAMISLVKSLAVELAPRGITVNSVAPGWVDTEMVASALAAAGRSRVEANIPIGRVASADDIAGPIVFLCSTWARHITGEIVNVNGGAVLCG